MQWFNAIIQGVLLGGLYALLAAGLSLDVRRHAHRQPGARRPGDRWPPTSGWSSSRAPECRPSSPWWPSCRSWRWSATCLQWTRVQPGAAAWAAWRRCSPRSASRWSSPSCCRSSSAPTARACRPGELAIASIQHQRPGVDRRAAAHHLRRRGRRDHRPAAVPVQGTARPGDARGERRPRHRPPDGHRQPPRLRRWRRRSPWGPSASPACSWACAGNFDPNYGQAMLIFAFEAVIIGGLGSLWGTLAGGDGPGRRPGARLAGQPVLRGADRPPGLPGDPGLPTDRPACRRRCSHERRAESAPARRAYPAPRSGARPSRRGPASPSIVALVLLAAPRPVRRSTRGIQGTLVTLFALIVMATMWNLLAGYGGMLSVGQQAYIGIGAYALVYLADTVGARPVHGGAARRGRRRGCSPIPISFLAFRLSGGYFAIGTWVIAIVVMLIVQQIPALGGGIGETFTGFSELGPRHAHRLRLLALAGGRGHHRRRDLPDHALAARARASPRSATTTSPRRSLGVRVTRVQAVRVRRVAPWAAGWRAR